LKRVAILPTIALVVGFLTVLVTSPAQAIYDRDCSDFATQAQAQAWFNTYYPYYGDVAKLDSDGDRIACETLPGHP
jgi:hypothetical protein